MGVIVYLSAFGGLSSPLYGVWWSIAIVAVFSVIIYYWAMAVALPAARIEQMIGEVVLPEEEGVMLAVPATPVESEEADAPISRER
jgi:hypothetical protein